jgi:hypothetical protein
MEKYKPSDYLHYEQGEEGRMDNVYFGVSEKFFKAVVSAMQEGERLLAVEVGSGDGFHNVGHAQAVMLRVIEDRLGELRLNQLLCVAHMISGRIGFAIGIVQGQQSVIEMMNQQEPDEKTDKNWRGTRATA